MEIASGLMLALSIYIGRFNDEWFASLNYLSSVRPAVMDVAQTAVGDVIADMQR
jgi:hypothetical protein